MAPRFDSPIGGKNFESQPLMEFDVSDESGPPPTNLGDGRRQQQVNDAANMNLAAIQEFQQRMNQQYKSTQYQAPTHSSSNENIDISVAEREFREMRELQRTGKSKLNDGAKRRIEMLLGMTRSMRTVTLESGDYTLQTLKSKEMREAIFEASKFDGTVESPYEVRKQFLARSLIQIAGVEVDQFVGARDLESRMAVIDELDESLVNRLHKEYLLLVEEARNKYAIKSESDVKEVLEDLKK